MSKVIMLTKDDCPKCKVAKQYISLGLDEELAEQIEIIKLEDDSEKYSELVEKYKVLGLPAFIKNEVVSYDYMASGIDELFED